MQPSDPPAARRLEVPAALLFVTGLAVVVFLFRIGSPSLWFDEAFSVDMVRDGFAPLDGSRGIEVTGMALYYAMLAPWITVSLDEGWIRLLTAIFVIAAVPLTWVLARRLFDARVATVAAVLLTLDPFTIRYAQEARSYGLLLFVAVLSTYLVIRAAQRPTWRAWILYGMVAALIPYTQLLGATVLVVHAWGALSHAPRPPWPRMLAAVAIVAIAMIPIAASAAGLVGGAVAWVPGPSFAWVSEQLLAMGGGEVAGGPNTGLRAVVGAAALGLGGVGMVVAAGVVPGRPRSWASVLVLAWWLLPIVGSILISIVKPIFVARYLIAGAPALAILGALAIDALPSTRWRVAVGGLAIGIAVVGAGAYYADPGRPDWRVVADHIAQHGARDERWLADPTWSWRATAFYAQRDADEAAFPVRLWRDLDSTDATTYPAALGRTAEAMAAEGRPIWLVVTGSSAGTTDVFADPRYAPFLQWYEPVEVSTFDRVRLIRFEPKA